MGKLKKALVGIVLLASATLGYATSPTDGSIFNSTRAIMQRYLDGFMQFGASIASPTPWTVFIDGTSGQGIFTSSVTATNITTDETYIAALSASTTTFQTEITAIGVSTGTLANVKASTGTCSLPNVLITVSSNSVVCQEPSNITGNAATVSNGVYTNTPATITSSVTITSNQGLLISAGGLTVNNGIIDQNALIVDDVATFENTGASSILTFGGITMYEPANFTALTSTITASEFVGSGAGLTSLSTTTYVLPSTVAQTNLANTFTSSQTISTNALVSGVLTAPTIGGPTTHTSSVTVTAAESVTGVLSAPTLGSATTLLSSMTILNSSLLITGNGALQVANGFTSVGNAIFQYSGSGSIQTYGGIIMDNPAIFNALTSTVEAQALQTGTLTTTGNVGVSSSNPEGLLTIGASTGTIFDSNGHYLTYGAAPSTSTCGTAATITGDDAQGTITVGTSAGTTCAITFQNAYSYTPRCNVNSSCNILVGINNIATSSVTFGGSYALSGCKLYYDCGAHIFP